MTLTMPASSLRGMPERIPLCSKLNNNKWAVVLIGVCIALGVIGGITVGILIAKDIISLNRQVNDRKRVSYNPQFYGDLHPFLNSDEREALGIKTDADVIVIGAGLAGVAAALTLQEFGDLEVIVMEARDRPGGRIMSAAFAEETVEIGSQWIHGAYNNPLASLAYLYQSRMALADSSQLHLVSFYSEQKGAVFSENQSFHSLSKFLEKLQERAPNGFQTQNKIGLANIFQLALNKSYLGYQVEGLSFDNPNSIEGPDIISLGGLNRIIDGFVQLINENSEESLGVHLDSQVSSVLSGDFNATVILNNGTTLSSQYVINTVPLGVVKEGSIRFTPSLPTETIHAIQRIGFESINPVHLLFDHPFWEPRSEMIVLPNESLNGWKTFLSLYTFIGRPILVAFPGNSASTLMEGMENDDIVDEIISVLRNHYGVERVPYPIRAMITQWGLNPFSRGTHSVDTADTTPEDRSTLSEPIRGCILFAGEAMSSLFPSTAHGALFSGIEQAQRILMTMELPESDVSPDTCQMECQQTIT